MALIPCQLKRKPRRQNLKADTLNTDVNPPEFRHIIFRAITETYKKRQKEDRSTMTVDELLTDVQLNPIEVFPKIMIILKSVY